MYSQTTHSIQITVKPVYLEEQSVPVENHYVWAYQVEILNMGPTAVQLLNRHWKITDSLGRLQEVKGPGVVGEQPVLDPGEAFQYTSGCPLTTPFGAMEGSYEMVTEGGKRFSARIARFELSEPGAIH